MISCLSDHDAAVIDLLEASDIVMAVASILWAKDSTVLPTLMRLSGSAGLIVWQQSTCNRATDSPHRAEKASD
jgi:hypothetical protein